MFDFKNPIRCSVCDGPFGGTIYKDRVLGLVCQDCMPFVYNANGLLHMEGLVNGIREPVLADKTNRNITEPWREQRF